MIRLGIIGAGTIFRYQIDALSSLTNKFCMNAICDSDIARLKQAKKLLDGTKTADDILFCHSVEELTNCDAVLISTPPQTHYQLAKACLEKGLCVLIEKPAVLSMDELLSLYALANHTHTLFHVAYHAAFAVDLLWWLHRQSSIKEQFALGQLSNIYCGFYDPYVLDGHTLLEKDNLMGSYIDSGVNQLSVCDRILDKNALDDFHCTDSNYIMDKKNTVIASQTEYTNGDITILLDTGWIYGLNRKRTVLQFKDCDKQVVLDHSNQRVIIQNALGKNDILSCMRAPSDIELQPGDVLLFENTTEPRLKRHYIGVFEDFALAFIQQASNELATKRIHRVLLDNQQLTPHSTR